LTLPIAAVDRVCTMTTGVVIRGVSLALAFVALAAAARPVPTASPPRTDNLVALEMGGRTEGGRATGVDAGYLAERALDGDPSTMHAAPVGTPLVLSFVGHDVALVSDVTITFASSPAKPPYGWPADYTLSWPKDVEVWLSTKSATDGFVKATAVTLPREPGPHVVKLPVPAEARFVKIVFPHNNGSPYGTLIDEVAVHEGQRGGYVPLLQRHGDLRALLATGKLMPDPASLAYQAPGNAGASCGIPPAETSPECPESKIVLVVATNPDTYAPYPAARYHAAESTLRYFGPGPGDGRVDSSIFNRVDYWPLQPNFLRPADFLPSARVDTVVLEQVCDIKTSVAADVKQALVAWVANGNKLIISDADSCGPGNVPDYSFLPYPLATSNPGGHAAASALQVLEQNFLVSPDSHDPAFFDEPSWRLKKNGNQSNDFGDSNTVVEYDDHWCGALFGTNALGASGFVMAYAHYGRGVIVYDGIDRDQNANLAYHQYSARQLLLPFRPDPLPCTLRVAPFAITTDVSLVNRETGAGQTITYPLTIIGAKPDFAGTVALSIVPPQGTAIDGHVEPATVSLGKTAPATLTIIAPAALAKPLTFGVRGTANGATGTLCLTIDALRRGHLDVVANVASPATPALPEKARKNLLVILDLSGSMTTALGKSTRIATARQVLHSMLQRVPDDFNVGLRVYGDRYGSKEKETCTDSHLVQPVQKIDRASLFKVIDSARPRGETPLVYSVLQAIGDLKAAGGGSVVLITDGEESCGGDFAAAAAAIKQSGLDFRLNIVGFTLEGQAAQKALGSLAASTGGAYYGAADGAALSRALTAATITKFPFSVQDANGKVVAQGEAGDAGHDLAPGDYTIVVQAGDQALTLPHVTVATGQTATVRVTRTGDSFVVSR
jgi:von Willebrand factor type A domain